MPRLVALDEDEANIPLGARIVRIGRRVVGRDGTLMIESIRASRLHCAIFWDPQKRQALVVDCDSTNGIRINGVRVDEGWLKPGDELSIAHLRYRLQDDEALDANARSEAALPILPVGVQTESDRAHARDELSRRVAAYIGSVLPADVLEAYTIQVILSPKPVEEPQPSQAAG